MFEFRSEILLPSLVRVNQRMALRDFAVDRALWDGAR